MERNHWLTIDQARNALREGTGRGIRIALLDSGVDRSMPRLKGFELEEDWAVTDDGLQLKLIDGKGVDVFGHGTAVCDIINRLAPEARIGSFRVLGEQLKSRTAIIREGARQALDRGYHILNCSFGCGREEQVLQYKDWIDEAYVKRRHIIAACNNYDARKREWPGHFPTVITVNMAPTPHAEALFYRSGYLVEFGARGQDLDVAWRGEQLKRVTGSSFAAPHATGLLARLLSSFPELPPLEAKALLQQLADPWPE